MSLENKAKLEKKYKNLIQMLKAKRESLKLTQQNIADKCGVSFTNISAIERGTQVCSSITLIGYMEAVGISFRSLEDSPSEVPNVPNVSNVSSKSVLSSFLECISEEEQMKIFEDIKKAMNINSELLELISSLSKEKQESLTSFASFLKEKEVKEKHENEVKEKHENEE